MKRITIYDIAKEVGVSPSTVSRAFSDTSLISKDKINKIRDTVERLDYRQDMIAKILRTKKTGSIALLLPDLLHACGNQNKVMDMIVLYKKRYVDKLAFLGNIDINKLLPFGTCEEVDHQVKYLIEKVGYNGGFVLGTCNAIMKDMPPENAVASYLSAEKYGHYPLKF